MPEQESDRVYFGFDDELAQDEYDEKENGPYGDESGDYVYCPRCGASIETDPDGAYCEHCHDYWLWPDLNDASDD